MGLKTILFATMDLDLWLLRNLGKSAKRLSHLLNLFLELTMIIGLAIALLSIYALSHSKLQLTSYKDEKFTDGEKKQELIGITDASNVYYSPEIKKEIDHLKSKALNLEIAYRKMNMQLRTMYNRDQMKDIELPDFASEAAGAMVLETPNTESYYESKNVLSLFGFPICKPNYFTPRKVIQPWSQAGECWAFRGDRGNIKIQLAYPAIVEKLTLEHVSTSASLMGKIDSAPKDFKVSIPEGSIDTEIFLYDQHGPSSQLFHITNPDFEKTPIKILTLNILSNWGNPNYTCVYRFKVHGKIAL